MIVILQEVIQNGAESDCSWIEQRSVIKFLGSEKRKTCEIYWRMHWEARSSKKIYINGQNTGLPQWAHVEKTIYEVETYGISSNDNVSGTVINKVGHSDNWFPWKKCNCKQIPIVNTLGKIHFIY